MKIRTTLAAAWIAAVAFTLLNMSVRPVSAQIVIDNFSSTQSGVAEDVIDPPFGPIPNTISETGLSGVIGGGGTTRTTTAALDGGASTAITGTLNPVTATLTGGAGPGATGTLSLNYSPLASNLSGFLGVAIDVASFDGGTNATDTPVTVTLSDGVNSATGIGLISGTGELIIPPSAFVGLAGVDLSDIESIDIVFELDLAQDFVINSIVALTPEPVTLLLWSSALLGFALFWKRYGGRIRQAA